jgi:hypothetical protein
MKFQKTYCSQCGGEFGPGDHGYSHCSDHRKDAQQDEPLETTIRTQEGPRVSVSEWDEGGAWLHLSTRNTTAYAALSRKEAEQLLIGLQSILAKELVA